MNDNRYIGYPDPSGQGSPPYGQGNQPFGQGYPGQQGCRQPSFPQNAWGPPPSPGGYPPGYQQPPPPPPPPAPPAGYYQLYQPYQPADNKRGLAIASLVLGIAAIILSCWPMLTLPFGAAAIVLGCFGMRSVTCKGMAMAGIICGGVGLAILLFWFLAYSDVLWTVWDFHYW